MTDDERLAQARALLAAAVTFVRWAPGWVVHVDDDGRQVDGHAWVQQCLAWLADDEAGEDDD